MSADAAPAQYRLDDLRIDVARQRVVRDDGQVLEVSGLSFRLLLVLLGQGTRVVGFDELIERVWAPAHVGEETVTQRVRLLRQALGDDGRQPRYLRSVRGRGYQLCSEPRIEEPATPTAVELERRPHALPIAVLLMLTLSTLGALLWWSWPRSETPVVSPLLERAAYYAAIGQPANNERAIALYRQRLQEAPDDSTAQLGLSRAYSARLCLYSGNAEDATQALALAEAVIARQPEFSAAHAALAYAHDCRGEVIAALAGYTRAVQLDPTADGSRASAAYLQARQGHIAEALAANLDVRAPETVRFLQLQIASNLDLLGYTAAAEARYRRSFQLYPDNVFSNLAWPTFLYEHGRLDEAQTALTQAMSRGTEHAGLHLLAAELALLRGEHIAAREAVQQARALKPQASLPETMAWITGVEPPPDAAALRARAATLRAGLASGTDPFDGIDAALLQSQAGDTSAALDALDAAITAGFRNAGYLRVSPLFADLRTAPAFDAALRRIDTALAAERAAVQASGRLPDDAVTASR
ncbi:winged helix-turn-helix domain-containing protein [Luteimonas fraxinea]|uniref:Winged helix-turn-helix domain-containing protein n=1 Tax=Luteimonas fraxinea TaxID=2901869 RepID=A0ABS8UDN2_9GAMM|nr:winged helix-turn-helix transcriptional regulator [Luteimonas fraxinea]MCD9097602.1 winged helix-turn-helix domain-containing protein [Luteimonas fraxinea]MCD9124847.1 winged helix-turn-helix domain-containing protein [Luteimonas fraxinea]UHH08501.1 winged helix-turn-helix domain-containing protein [Luteimonas fraxinea]